uniref:Odorant receptor n=1 Tax=Leucinodes orbonalis TaxID=711050 RepID=A0AAU0QLK4_9NEOP|nr:odorant receptor [Leucinodes orbonalis]
MDGLEILPEEYVKPFRRCLEVLKRSNIMFPSENSSFWKTNWRFLYMAPLHIMHFLSLTAYIVKIVIEGQDVFQQANVIPMWLVTAEVTVKTTLLLMKRDDLKNVVIHLGSMWRTEGLNEEQILLKKAALKRVKYTEFIFYRISLAVTWQYTMLPLVELTVRRLIFHQDVELQLAFAAIYPFEVTNIYIYLIMYAFQTYCGK